MRKSHLSLSAAQGDFHQWLLTLPEPCTVHGKRLRMDTRFLGPRVLFFVKGRWWVCRYTAAVVWERGWAGGMLVTSGQLSPEESGVWEASQSRGWKAGEGGTAPWGRHSGPGEGRRIEDPRAGSLWSGLPLSLALMGNPGHVGKRRELEGKPRCLFPTLRCFTVPRHHTFAF